jgi:long-chain acyl-CoA synthetase
MALLNKIRLRAPSESGPHDGSFDGDGYPMTFPELLEQSRRKWGSKAAFQQKVRRDWVRFSHADVHARSYELAAGLSALGVCQGDRVALVMENGVDWVCAYYAIALNGAVAVPVYYDLKPGEIAGMLTHAEPSVAIVSAKVLPKIEPLAPRLRAIVVAGDVASKSAVPHGLLRKSHPELLSLEELAGRATAESRAAVTTVKVFPDDLASIVFTSGTSGGSKGVMLTHRNFLANTRSCLQSMAFGERDRIVMVLPLHHAFPFIVTVALCPAAGGEVTFENDLRRIRDRMAEVKPTIFLGVPALFELMYRNVMARIEAEGRLETFEKGLRIVEATKQRTGVNIGRIVFRELHKRLGGSLRFMVSGGAALNPEVARNFALLGVPVLQGWGLTESSPVLAVQRWNPRRFYMSNYYEERVGTVGQALKGVEVALIDVPEKELYVHLHGEGELIARGENITPGYWRSEDATGEAKLNEWLRTGDIGRIDEEGNVWITGRSKFVIVLDSGEKVHPDELEEKLARSPVIEDIVVTGKKLRGKTQVAAVVYPNRDAVLEQLGDAATPDAVRGLVKEEIDRNEADVAAHKRTTDLVLTDTPLPKTALRKVMRGQLAESHTFELDTWERTWADVEAANSGQPAGEQEDEEEAVISV